MKALGTFITMFLLTNEAVQAIEQQDLTLTKDPIAGRYVETIFCRRYHTTEKNSRNH